MQPVKKVSKAQGKLKQMPQEAAWLLILPSPWECCHLILRQLPLWQKWGERQRGHGQPVLHLPNLPGLSAQGCSGGCSWDQHLVACHEATSARSAYGCNSAVPTSSQRKTNSNRTFCLKPSLELQLNTSEIKS